MNNWYKLAQQDAFPFMDGTISFPPPSDPSYAPKTVELLEELLYDIEGIPAVENILNKYGFEWEKIQFPEDLIIKITIDNKIYIIPDASFDTDLEDPQEWIASRSDADLYRLMPPDDFDITFWKDVTPGDKLYHTTDEEGAQGITQNGIQPRNRTRGMSNRSTGSAVFTSDNPDDITSYGDYVFEIDVGQMKTDGYTPSVSKETPMEEAATKEAIAHRLELYMDFRSEYESEGIYDSTIIFYDTIPAKYLKAMNYPDTKDVWVS